MKSFDLNAMSVQEMSLQEQKKENGGNGVVVVGIAVAKFLGAALLGGLAYEALTEGGEKCWEDFKKGYNSTRN